MKVVVITMHAVKNYGSVLQTYATQKVLSKMGHNVEIVNYIRKKNLNSNLADTWTRNDHGAKKEIKKIIITPTVFRWKKVFGNYLETMIQLTPYTYVEPEDFKKHPIYADVYSTGSDQVWNSGWNQGIEKAFYLDFAPKNAKRIAIAASIGKPSLDQEEVETILPMLEKYNHISMREMSAVKLLREIGLKNVEFCLDPTLLLTQEEWMEHALPFKAKKKYLLVYQLNHDKKFDRYVVELAKRKNLELLRVCTRYDQCRLPGKAIILPEVRQLLGLFSGAELVVTNSFHAIAFCINLNKNFVAIYPNEYSCRIGDTLELFDLQDRQLINYNQYGIADNPIDFKKVNEILKEKRNNSISLIEKMLE